MEYARSVRKMRNRLRLKKEYIAPTMAAIRLLVILLAILFVTFEMHHECEGENCPTCELIIKCNRFIKEISSSILIITIIAIVFFINYYKETFSQTEYIKKESLVSLNIKLLN
jgi:hypothetical protein